MIAEAIRWTLQEEDGRKKVSDGGRAETEVACEDPDKAKIQKGY